MKSINACILIAILTLAALLGPTTCTAAPLVKTSVTPEQQALLGYAAQMLQYASDDAGIHIVNVPQKPASFAIKGPSADMYCSLLKKAKKSADAESVLALLSFYKTTLKSQPADNALPDYGELKSQLADFLASEYKIVLDPPKDGSLPMYLLYLKGFEDFSDTDEQGNLKATDRNLNLKVPKEVQIEAFEQAPDGRLTVNWNPCYLACWILYGDASFVNNVKKDIDTHLDENSELLVSKEKLGEMKPREANHERLMFASNYVASIVKSFESDGEQYLIAATADGCAKRLSDVVSKYDDKLGFNVSYNELPNQILDAVLRYEPVADGREFSKENVAAFTLRTAAEQKTNSLNQFPGSWLSALFDEPSEIICPDGKCVYAVLPPMKYAESLDVVVSAMQGHPKIQEMSGEVPVVYCPFHHIVGLTGQKDKSRDEYAGCLYLGSNTNFLSYCDSVNTKWRGQEQWNKKVQPNMRIEYGDGRWILPLGNPMSMADLHKEVIDLLMAQESVRTQQVIEMFKSK